MDDRCARCMTEVPERSGFQTTRGDVLLCGSCYVAMRALRECSTRPFAQRGPETYIARRRPQTAR